MRSSGIVAVFFSVKQSPGRAKPAAARASVHRRPGGIPRPVENAPELRQIVQLCPVRLAEGEHVRDGGEAKQTGAKCPGRVQAPADMTQPEGEKHQGGDGFGQKARRQHEGLRQDALSAQRAPAQRAPSASVRGHEHGGVSVPGEEPECVKRAGMRAFQEEQERPLTDGDLEDAYARPSRRQKVAQLVDDGIRIEKKNREDEVHEGRSFAVPAVRGDLFRGFAGTSVTYPFFFVTPCAPARRNFCAADAARPGFPILREKNKGQTPKKTFDKKLTIASPRDTIVPSRPGKPVLWACVRRKKEYAPSRRCPPGICGQWVAGATAPPA